MVSINIGTGLGEEALTILAHTVFQLLSTGGVTEVSRGATHIVNITLKARQLGNNLGLTNDGLVAARLDNTPLMRMNRAKGTATKATATAHNTKLHLF